MQLPAKNKLVLFVIIIALFCMADSNFILSVSQTNSIVNASNKLGITIKTSTAINNNSLIVYFVQAFTLNNNTCLINVTAINCPLSFNSTTALYSITLGMAFLTNTTYVLYVNVSNPYYSSNFQITASNLSTVFLTLGTVTIDPKTINSSLTGLSSQVGAQTIGIFSLNNDIVPANSIVYIQSATQTVFKNLMTSSVSCAMDSISLPCTVTTLFGNQILQISSVPAMINIVINVTSINNPPYNNTFIPIQIRIQDSLNRLMQSSNFTQNPPSLLATSNNVIINNWNSTIGEISLSSFFISTFFNTIANQSLMVEFNNALSIIPGSPAVYSQTIVGNRTRIYVSNVTLGTSSIQFSSSIQNPSWIQPISISVYVLFNSTNFMQQYNIPSSNMELQGYTSNVTNSLAISLTGILTAGNLTFSNLNPILNQGVAILLTLQFGKFSCLGMTIASSISGLAVQSCNDSALLLYSSSNLNVMTYWVRYAVINHFSIQPYSISFVLETLISKYAVSTGSAKIELTVNTFAATITNSNTELGKITSMILSQSLSNLQINFSNYLSNTSVQRIVWIYPPSNLVLNSNTTIVSLNLSLCQLISILHVDISLIKIQIAGYLSIKILNLSNNQIYVFLDNPLSYNVGQRTWNITTYDTLSFLGQTATSIIQTPEYTQTSSSFSFNLQNKTIQQNSTLSLTISPQLEYSSFSTPPLVSIILSDSQILSWSSCPSTNCTQISSKQLIISYYSPIMEMIFNIRNSNYPTPINSTIFVSIYAGIFVYESLSSSYSLEPLQFGYIQLFSGLYQQIGVLTINLTATPLLYTSLSYSGINQIMQSSVSCQPCNSTFLNITGKVIYFQNATIVIYGVSMVNQTNITFAISNVQISYPCSQIQGCRICSNFTNATTNATALICTKCFDSTLTSFSLLYYNKCYDFCPISTYSTGVSCVNCQDLCYNCSAAQCLECDPGFFLLNNTCVAKCPAGYLNNLTSCYPVPIICPSYCVDCPLDNQCSKCASRYYLLSNICYRKCPSGYKGSQTNGMCQIFIPPEQAKYYPFAYLIVSSLILIVLAIIKCFEKRSLMMGNFIAFMSLLQFGSILLTLSYTFLDLNQQLWTQSLIFVVVLSKISLNMIFLVYFMTRVSKEEEFTNWKEKQPINSTIYKILIILSSLLSFQILRIIYSRLFGFQIFFGRFSSGLIFKPMNYFSLGYALTFSVALIILCVTEILAQEGYKTTIFYTCVQTIIIEAILMISCLIESQRSGADQFFDYQVYKVQNEFQDGSFNPIILTSQKQTGGSNQDLLKLYKKLQNSSKKVSSQNHWRRKTTAVSEQPHYANQSLEEINESPSFQQDKTRMNIFRVKFIKDWKELQKTLPKTNIYKMKKSQQYISVSPNSRRNIKKDFQKSSSVEKIEVKIPEYTNSSIGERIKNYFHVIDESESQSRSMVKDAKTQRKTDYQDIKTNKPSNNNFSNQNQSNNQRQNQVIFNNRRSLFQNNRRSPLQDSRKSPFQDNRRSPLQDQLLEQQELQQFSHEEYKQKNKTNLQDMLDRLSENNISQNVINNYDQQFSNRKLNKSPGRIIHQSFEQGGSDFRPSRQIQFNQKSIQLLNNNFANFRMDMRQNRQKNKQEKYDVKNINPVQKSEAKQRNHSSTRNNSRTRNKSKNKGQERLLTGQKGDKQRTNSFSKRNRAIGNKRRVNKQTESVYLQRLTNGQSVHNPNKANKRYKQLSDF